MRHKAGAWLVAIGLLDQVMIAALLAWTWRVDLDPISLFALLLIVPGWRSLHAHFGLYDSHRLEGWRGVVSATLTASTVGFLAAAVALLAIGLGGRIPALAQFAGLWVAHVLLSRAVSYGVVRSLRRQGADRRYSCIIGSWEKATELAREFADRPEWGLQVSLVGVGPASDRTFYYFTGSASEPDPGSVAGHRLEDILRDEVVDEILIAAHPRDVGEEQEAIRLCKEAGIQCRLCLLGDDLVPTKVDYIPGHVAWTVQGGEASSIRLTMKRMVDVVLSGTLLLLLSPLFVLLALLVKLSSPGPVFFRQLRAGLRGREFVMIKFRTMIVGADEMLQLLAHRNITGGPIFKDSGDWRVTPIGRVLRRFSLDELPQLVNVFLGDMSLVGPRPLPLHESAAIEGEHRRRFNMKPGITCRWQVQGRSEIPFAQWMQLDVDYVDNWSLREDLKLLLLTLPAVLTGKGAY